MQKSLRANEQQLYYLVNKARENGIAKLAGNLWKKSLDTSRWQLRYFILYQNLLFYFDCERAERPSGVIFLESSYCQLNVNLKSSRDDKIGGQQGHCFTISYRKEGVRQYDLRADTEEECSMWVEAINSASFSKLLELKQEAEQKQLHLSQILETELRAKWHYVKQIEELTAEIKQLKYEFNEFRIDRRFNLEFENESEELKKIKKVQSFFRGWLCRRRWKHIVEEYIRSEHAESMRKRNSIVFGLVECEDEYVQQLSILVTCYLRPFRMAASSKKPIVTHEDVNSIFLNAEAVLFLHQVFVQGLRNKMEHWPTLQLGDLFDLLLPMLGIYQEYVRNHHYSLQVLAEYKQRPEFTHMLKRLEEKPLCEGRSIESFLTYPMHQIPRYIITLHELLAHTPYDHVDRKKLEFATSKLEQISHIMHDEVSETENIRKNLAIERMIVDGCDLLLDVNQVFVRQGTLIQVMCDKLRSSRSRLSNFGTSCKERKEAIRQVFLFTNHLLITARTNNGKLRLVKNCGKISLVECTLVEDTTAELFNIDDEDQTNLGSDQKAQQENGSHIMTRSNIAPLLSSSPLNTNINSELHSRNSYPVNIVHDSSHQHQHPHQLHKRYTCPDSTLNRNIPPVNTAYRVDQLCRSIPLSSGGGIIQQSLPTTTTPTSVSWLPSLSVQHRHSASLCTSSTTGDTDVQHSTIRSPINQPATTIITNSGTTFTPMSNISNASNNTVQTRSSSNVSYSTTAPTTSAMPTTATTTPDINVVTSPTSTQHPTSPSFSMLHRFSSNMGLLNSLNTTATCNTDKTDYGNLDFRLIWEPKNGQPTSIWLVASTLQEKAAWCSDISQCIEQLHYGDILNSAQSDVSSVAMPQSIRSDPKLFKDDVDIKFSHTLNSCKVPQIRYATVSRLLDRLTDARFLSIDFLNTFLLTYRVFTTGLSVIWSLNQVLANPDVENSTGSNNSSMCQNQNQSFTYSHFDNPEPRDPWSIPRPSEISLTTTTTTTANRLPVLEEAVNSRIDDTSPSPNSASQTDDRCELHHSNNNDNNNIDGNSDELTTATQQSSSRLEHTTMTNTEVSNASVSKIKSQKKLLPSPLSTSDMNPSPTVSGQEYNPGCSMSRSEIGDSRSFFSEKQSCKSFMNRSFHSSSSSSSSTAVKSPIITTQSTTVLIPRSPVYSTLVDLRDDPPLELPILPNPKTSEKKQQPRESKDPVKEASSTPPIPSHDDIDEGTGTVKGHARLAPLASCEVIPDETDPAGNSKQETVKDFKTPLSSSKENIASENSITPTTNTHVDPKNSTTVHNTTISHLDSQLDKTDDLIRQGEIQPSVDEHAKEQLNGVRREKSEDETHSSSKQSESTNTSKSDIEISVSYENQPKEYLNYAPMTKINTQNIESRHFKQTMDQLSILNSQQFSHSWTTINRIACKNDTDDYNDCDVDDDEDNGIETGDGAVYNHHENDTPKEDNTDSRIKRMKDCQILKKLPLSATNLKDNDRLLENYLNQTIGSSLLATENNYDRQQQQQQQQQQEQQSSGNCDEKAVPEDNTPQGKNRSESVNCTHPVKPANSTKQSTVSLKPHPTSHHPSQKYFPVAESLDLATRLTAITKSPKSFSACQSLAKHTMIAALNCSRAFTGLQKSPNENRNSDAGVNSSIQSKYLEDNYPEFKEIIRSSPSSPKKYSEGSVIKNKNTKPNVNIHDASQTRENDNIKLSPKFSTESRTTPEVVSTRESPAEARRSVPSFRSTRPMSSVEIIRQKKTDTVVNEQRKLVRKTNKGQDSNNSEEGRHHQETLQPSSSSVTNTNSQTSPSDIMVKERQDSLIPQQLGIGDCARGSVVSWSGVSHISKPKRPSVFSCPEAEFESPRSSVIHPSLGELASNKRTRPGAVVTSSRRSKRRSSNTAAAQAFAVATAGSANPLAAVGIMGLGPNLFRPGGYRFSAGTATAAATQVGLRSGSSSLSGSNTSIAVSGAVTNRTSVQSTSSTITSGMYPISTGANNPVSQSGMGTMTPPPPPGGTSLTSTVGSSLVQPTSTVNTGLRYNLARNGLTSTTTTTNNPSVSASNTFNFHSYNLTSPTLIQHSSGSGVGVAPGATSHHCTNQAKRNTMLATASCLRVLNVVRHWITKFPDDFQSDSVLKREMQTLLDALVTCPHLMPNDQKVAGQLLLQMISDQLVHDRIDLDSILTPTQIPSEKNFDQLSALDISEQLTFLDFQIFRSIRSEELLNQSWMKLDKEEKAKHVLLVCKRFNEVSRLVVSEIISRTDLNDRVMCIDKWVAIADICRCMQNYNGVLQICAALVNSSVYRLKRTWERVSKQTKQSIDRLQMLVASDGRFKSMREALHRCDPPCIPYLGMYLTDLSFIEEGALNITENNLVNFCKMRMIAHVIREVQQYHQTPYLITHRREVTDYLLDPTRLLDEEQTYQASLIIEPRQSINRQPPTGLS